MQIQDDTLLKLIGVQAVFKKGQGLSEQALDFYGSFFARAKEVNTAGQMCRYIRFESKSNDESELIFIGLEVQDITSIPSGMVAWVLSKVTLRIYEQKGDLPELTAKNDIGWYWCENALIGGKCRTVGDFYVQNTQITLSEQNLQFKDFHITANAYTDTNREIEGGDKVELVEYAPLWIKEYADFAKWLTNYLGSDIVIRIEHFGSTAIPNMPAKPIIDVMVEVPTLEEARNHIIKLLNSETWEYWWFDDHMTFIKREKFMGKRTHHIHIAPRKHELWNRLSFRDYLRNHTEDALRYANLKHELSICYEQDRERYTNAKGDFVQEITRRAMEEVRYL